MYQNYNVNYDIIFDYQRFDLQEQVNKSSSIY